MYLPKPITAPKVRVYTGNDDAVLTKDSLIFGSTVYGDGHIAGQLEFTHAPVIATPSVPASAATNAYVDSELAAIFAKDHIWTGNHVFDAASASLTILDNLDTYVIQNITLDYLIWVRSLDGYGTLYLPNPAVINQKITVKAECPVTVVTTSTSRIIFDENSFQDPTQSVSLVPSSALHLYYIAENTWIINSNILYPI